MFGDVVWWGKVCVVWSIGSIGSYGRGLDLVTRVRPPSNVNQPSHPPTCRCAVSRSLRPRESSLVAYLRRALTHETGTMKRRKRANEARKPARSPITMARSAPFGGLCWMLVGWGMRRAPIDADEGNGRGGDRPPLHTHVSTYRAIQTRPRIHISPRYAPTMREIMRRSQAVRARSSATIAPSQPASRCRLLSEMCVVGGFRDGDDGLSALRRSNRPTVPQPPHHTSIHACHHHEPSSPYRAAGGDEDAQQPGEAPHKLLVQPNRPAAAAARC